MAKPTPFCYQLYLLCLFSPSLWLHNCGVSLPFVVASLVPVDVGNDMLDSIAQVRLYNEIQEDLGGGGNCGSGKIFPTRPINQYNMLEWNIIPRSLSPLLFQIPVTEDNVESIVTNLTQVINDISTIDDDGLESIAIILEGIVEVGEPNENVRIMLFGVTD